MRRPKQIYLLGLTAALSLIAGNGLEKRIERITSLSLDNVPEYARVFDYAAINAREIHHTPGKTVLRFDIDGDKIIDSEARYVNCLLVNGEDKKLIINDIPYEFIVHGDSSTTVFPVPEGNIDLCKQYIKPFPDNEKPSAPPTTGV